MRSDKTEYLRIRETQYFGVFGGEGRGFYSRVIEIKKSDLARYKLEKLNSMTKVEYKVLDNDDTTPVHDWQEVKS